MENPFKIRKDIPKNLYIGLAAASFVILIGAWALVTCLGLVDPIFLPAPVSVIKSFVESIKDNSLWGNLLISCYRIFMGFFIAVLIGVPLGILVGTYKAAEAFIQPLTEFMRYMPVPAFVPLIMIWTGIGEEAKIAVIVLGILFQVIPMIADNVKNVPADLLDASYTLGARSFTVICHVLVPAALPKIMDTLRMVMGWAWTYLTVAELVASNSGLGYSILKAQRFMKTYAIFMGILVIGILGLIIDRSFAFLNKKLFSWSED